MLLPNNTNSIYYTSSDVVNAVEDTIMISSHDSALLASISSHADIKIIKASFIGAVKNYIPPFSFFLLS